ncbi:2-phosphosulfolactate phosphatase [bacterium]|nr:2-phosphosulfolactate phosphatase [bacterium]
MTTFKFYSLAEAHNAEGTVVVIDVLRAFTTAAFAFAGGARQIFPVGGVDEALALHAELGDALIMGEVDGFKPKGFDFGNSPAALMEEDLSGRIMIQRTSAGTQGLNRATKADHLLAASFVVAGATTRYLRNLNPDLISFVITGTHKGRDGDEDRACADYLAALIQGENPSPETYLNRVGTSTVGRDFQFGEVAYILQQDFDLGLDLDRFDFAMPVRSEHGRLVMEKVDA